MEVAISTREAAATASRRSREVGAGIAFFLGILALRVFGANYRYFFEGDEISLAAGAAALVQNNGGDFYRYGPQVGYHRLVELIANLLGGDPTRIPIIMTTMSAISGAVIPAAGLVAFRSELSRGERWLLALVLAVNPIVWLSSTYGGSAMPSVAAATLGLALLSSRPGPRVEVLALVCVGAGVFIRADAVLVLPAAGLLLFLNHRSLSAALARFAALVAALAVVFGAFLMFDPLMADAVASVREHLTNPRFVTRFWEYLLWATSPPAAILAVWGLRELIARKPLPWVVLAWCLPPFVFYFASTTTPRYFLLTAFPIALCTVAGLMWVGRELSRLLPARLAQAAVVLLTLPHLFIGLGHFAPGLGNALFWQSSFETHDGPMWTGAYLYKTYFEHGFLIRSFRNDGFGRSTPIALGLDAALADVASGTLAGRTAVVLFADWNGHAYHYHAQASGARHTARESGPLFHAETHMELGGAQLISFFVAGGEYSRLEELPVRTGDELWLVNLPDPPDEALRVRFPQGLRVVPTGEPTSSVKRYRFIPADLAGPEMP